LPSRAGNEPTRRGVGLEGSARGRLNSGRGRKRDATTEEEKKTSGRSITSNLANRSWDMWVTALKG